jgi:signal transduction histidine kinase
MIKNLRVKGFTFQLFALTVLPLTLLLILITFASTALHHQAMRTLVGSRDLRAARAAASAIGEQISHKGALLESLASQVEHAPFLDGLISQNAHLDKSFEAGVALFSPDGDLLSASQPAYWSSPSGQDALITLIAAARSELTFAPLFPLPTSGEALLGTAFPTSRGVVVAGAFSPQTLVSPALSGSFDGQHPSIAIYDRGFNPIYELGSHPLEDEPSVQSIVAAALAGEAGITFSTGDHSEQVIAYAPIQPLGWALVIQEPWQAITSPLLRTTQTAPLVLVPALLLALVALAFGARQIVQPLQTLAASAQELGRGRFQAIQEPVGGISEIRHLQDELVSMSQKVQEAQIGLHSYIGAITTAQEEERRRLARELHDDTLQALIALNQRIQLAQLSRQASPSGAQALQKAKPLNNMRPPDNVEALEEDQAIKDLQALTESTIANLRRLTRGLRPIYLEDLGLSASLQILAEENSRPPNPPIAFSCRGEARRLSPEVELALYRITQEALSNIARHARASQASINLAFTSTAVSIEISDNGIGFTPPDSPAVFARTGHFGLLGLYERAELIGASIDLRSEPGQGAWLKVLLPAG